MTIRVPQWAEDPAKPVPAGYLEGAFSSLLVAAEGADATREGLQDTPARAARAWRHLTSGYNEDPADLMTTFPADGADEIVLLRAYPFHSLCEHHLLGFTGHAHVGYLPGKRIAGASKLGRIVDCYARRLQVQERLTVQVADALQDTLKPRGVAVVVAARHLCMECRGVERSGQDLVTSAMRGVFRTKPEARAEALALMNGGS